MKKKVKAKIGMANPVDPSPLMSDSMNGVSCVIAPASIPSRPGVGSSGVGTTIGSIGVMMGVSNVEPSGSFGASWFAMYSSYAMFAA